MRIGLRELRCSWYSFVFAIKPSLHRCFPSLSDRKNFASRNLSDFYIVILGMTQEDVVWQDSIPLAIFSKFFNSKLQQKAQRRSKVKKSWKTPRISKRSWSLFLDQVHASMILITLPGSGSHFLLHFCSWCLHKRSSGLIVIQGMNCKKIVLTFDNPLLIHPIL